MNKNLKNSVKLQLDEKEKTCEFHQFKLSAAAVKLNLTEF